MTREPDLPAGGFSSWLRRARAAQLDESVADVPCDECRACCTSSYFVHVTPDETLTLARIPGELLFPAPGLPRGHVVMGYDKSGHCPMFRDNVCSIYEQRPLTCRTYDCRVFAAAGIDADRPAITRRARRWVFSYPTAGDRDEHAAVRAAARFLQAHAECFSGGANPGSPAHVALLAVKVSDVFLGRKGEAGTAGRTPSDAELVKAVIEADRRLEAGRAKPGADRASGHTGPSPARAGAMSDALSGGPKGAHEPRLHDTTSPRLQRRH